MQPHHRNHSLPKFATKLPSAWLVLVAGTYSSTTDTVKHINSFMEKKKPL